MSERGGIKLNKNPYKSILENEQENKAINVCIQVWWICAL